MKNEYKKFNDQVINFQASNGMEVVLVPRPKYKKVFAAITANYGAIDRKIKINNQILEIPAGAAHFLEHKLFEKEKYDAFELFGQNGADANAFTNQTETTYLFSATDKIQENLDNLIDFVFNPYFTDATVEKEQGIIGQEIMMYDDVPEWRLYNGILANLYPKQPLSDDIAGSVESIAKITAEMLYRIHDVFYQPSNLTLKIVGNFDVEQIQNWIEHILSHQKNWKTDFESIDSFTDEPAVGDQIIKMENVIQPKIAVGAKSKKPPILKAKGLKVNYAIEILIDLLFGESSDWFQENYDNGLIDGSFDLDYELETRYHYFLMNAQTNQPEKLKEQFLNQIEIAPKLISNSDRFQRSKKDLLGSMIKRLDSLEQIVLSNDEKLFDVNLFDEIQVVENIQQNDLKEAVEFIKDLNWTTLTLIPED